MTRILQIPELCLQIIPLLAFCLGVLSAAISMGKVQKHGKWASYSSLNPLISLFPRDKSCFWCPGGTLGLWNDYCKIFISSTSLLQNKNSRTWTEERSGMCWESCFYCLNKMFLSLRKALLNFLPLVPCLLMPLEKWSISGAWGWRTLPGFIVCM